MISKIDKTFDGVKPTKLGTDRQPAQVSVQTEERKTELEAVFEQHGWKHKITVDADKPEDIFDLERLQNPVLPATADPKVGRNEPCPCGSGKKYKRCCGK